MRKKTVVWAYLLVLSLGTILSLYIPKNEVAAKDAIVIPGQAIRLRILANSDLESDQALKRKVRDQVNAKISVWVKDLTSIKEARKVIKAKLPEIQSTAEAEVKAEGSTQAVHVKFGKVQFPTKLYGQFLYPAGDYEAILITLGEGKGANWWCVLFPPLCFLDFSNGIAVSKGFDEKKQKVEPQTAQAAESKIAKMKATESKSADRVDSNSQTEDDMITKLKLAKSADSQSQDKGTSRTKEKSVETTTKKVVAMVPKRVQKEMKLEETQAKATDDSEEVSTVKDDKKQQAPVYTTQDEEPIKVKFFVVELWNKIF